MVDKVDTTGRLCLNMRHNVLDENKKSFVGRSSNPFGTRAPIQWRALWVLTDFEVTLHVYNIVLHQASGLRTVSGTKFPKSTSAFQNRSARLVCGRLSTGPSRSPGFKVGHSLFL